MRSYPALEIIAFVYKAFATLVAITGITMSLFIMSKDVVTGFFGFIVTGLCVLILWAAAEMIKVFTDMSVDISKIASMILPQFSTSNTKTSRPIDDHRTQTSSNKTRKQCSSCYGEYSAALQKCPHCGATIKQGKAVSDVKIKETENQVSGNKTCSFCAYYINKGKLFDDYYCSLENEATGEYDTCGQFEAK